MDGDNYCGVIGHYLFWCTCGTQHTYDAEVGDEGRAVEAPRDGWAADKRTIRCTCGRTWNLILAFSYKLHKP